MARQVAILVSCDACNAPDLAPDRALVLAVANDAPRQIDLCDSCQVKLWGPLAELYAMAATAPPREEETPRERRPVTCPECGYKCPSRSALRSHLEIRHKTDAGLWQAEHGHAIDDPDQPVPFTCDDCNPRRAFVNPQGLAQHRRALHSATP